MIKRYFIVILVIIAIGQVSLAQDIHFSQSYNSPLSLNPATTGNYKGDYRIICNYKDQWRSVGKVYKTIFASADFVPVRKKRTGNSLGIGLSFYNDKAGKAKLGTTQINLSIAYTLKLDRYNYMAAGLQAGYTQKGINANNLKWDNQFNGISYDPNIASVETNYNNQVNYMDFAAGVLWNFIPNDKHKTTLGISMFHVNKPIQSFSKTDKDQLNPKIVVHATGQFGINDKKTAIEPILLFTNQGKLNEINAGGLIKYGLGLDSKYTGANKPSSVSFGALYRVKDAVIILVNMNYKSTFTFGFSYDINVSSLTTASRWRGGMEVCVVYSGFFNGSK